MLAARGYRVEAAGGVQRERDPSTSRVLKEAGVPPALLFTLERQGNGLYRGVTYGQGGQPQSACWVNDRCEITDAQGNPLMDGWRCPLYPSKPYLVYLLAPPAQGFPPSAQLYSGGRLADDFDGDGVVEMGYLKAGGGSGQAGGGSATGSVHALGHDPKTLTLKFEYLLFGNQGQSAAATWLTENLVYYRVEARQPRGPPRTMTPVVSRHLALAAEPPRRGANGWRSAHVALRGDEFGLHVVVVGAGKLGFEVAKRLADKGEDVAVIDRDQARLQEVSERLDVLTVCGNGASPAALQRAGMDRADLVLAVTEADEVNIIACVTAKHMAASQGRTQAARAGRPSQSPGVFHRVPGRPLCAARIRNPEYAGSSSYTRLLRQIGVDAIINPDRLTALEGARLVRARLASHIDFFADGRVVLVGLKIAEDAPLVTGTLREVNPPCLVVAVVREGQLFIPDGRTRLQPGDRVYLVGKAGSVAEFRALAGLPGRPVREVTIIGGGKVGFPLAQLLLPAVKRGLHLRVIERNPARCSQLAEALPGVLVICGDGERIDVLRDEQVGSSDVLVAVTSQDHTNLLAAMIAKELGTSEVIVSVSREDYVPLAERAGADAVVVPRLLAAATALQLLNSRHVLSLSILEEGRAQVLELVVGEGAPAARSSLKSLSGLRDAVVGALVRNGDVLIPTGDTVLMPEDRLIVFALPEAVSRLQTLFEGREADGVRQ